MKKLLNLRTALFISLSFCVGILFSYSIFLNAYFYTLFLSITFALLIILYIIFCFKDDKRLKGFILSSIFIIFAVVGAGCFTIKVNDYINADMGNHYHVVVARVVDASIGSTNKKLVLDEVILDGDTDKLDYKISLQISGESSFDIGDIISFSAVIEDKSAYYNGDLSFYSIDDKIKFSSSVYADEVSLLNNQTTIFEKVNLFIRDTARNGLDEKEFSVVYALLTGNSNYMENELITNFRASGVAHIFAVSGLHIGFLASVLSFVFSKLKLKKIISTPIIILVLFFYSGVCGFSSSSIRASVMYSVMLFASIFGEKYDGVSGMGIALLIVLLISPFQLFFAGFQLSFGVVFSILVLTNPLKNLLKFLPEKLANPLASVLSAQIASVPIMIMHFKAFSLISVVVNLLFLPIVCFIFVFSLTSIVTAGIIGASAILLPLNFLVKLIIFVIELFDFTVFLVGGITLGFCVIFYYFGVLSLSGLINLKPKIKMVISLSLFGCFIVGSSLNSFCDYNAVKIYSTANDYLCVSVVDYKDSTTLIVNKQDGSFGFYSLENLARNKGITEFDNVIILDGNEQVDIQILATRLNSFSIVKNIFYYGEKDEEMENITSKSFPDVHCENFKNDCISSLPIKNQILLDGRGIKITFNDKNAIFFGELKGNEVDLGSLGGQVDYSVAVNYVENLYSIIDAKNGYSYLFEPGYKSVKSEGNIIYYLK